MAPLDDTSIGGAGAASASTPLLRITRVSKSFPGLRALADVSIDVHAGEVVSIVGQNGSGKSTLVKVLAGIYDPDPGSRIEGGGEGAHDDPPSLRFIHQDLGLVDSLSTIENLDLAEARGIRSLLPYHDRREARSARAAIRRFGARFDVSRPVGDLTAAERSIVAITRAMDDWDPTGGVLILDEPTAALPRSEDEILFEAIRRVAKQGAGIIYISHHLDEVMGISDRVVALRDGRKVADLPVAEVDHERLVSLIAGRAVADLDVRRSRVKGGVALAVSAVGGETVDGIDFELRKGEILGVAGLLGSGRDELAAILFGAKGRTAGEVRVGDALLPPGDPGAAIRAGVAFVPADRRRDGAVMTMSVQENLTLPSLRPLRRPLFRLDGRAEHREARSWIRQVGLSPQRPDQALNLFSGGNQQKVVLAKWLRIKPAVLLLDEPTQGIDVGAKASIYELIAAAAEAGTAVLIASSDTKELTAMCDRVIVLREGRIGSIAEKAALTEQQLISQTLRTRSSSTDQTVIPT